MGNTRSHHETSLWDEKRSPMVRLCHRVIFGLILFILVYSVLVYGTTQPWTQGPLIAAVVLAAVFWAIRIIVVKEVEVVFSPLGAPMMVAGIFVIIRYALAEVEPISRSRMLMAITAIIFYFVVLNDIRHRWQVTVVVWTITGMGVFLSVYGLFQVLRGGQSVLGLPQFPDYRGQASGAFFRPTDLAVYLHMAFAVAAANFALSRRSQREKVGFAFACLIMCGGMFLTFSPLQWIAWLVMFVTLGVFIVRKRSWQFRWVIAGSVALLVVAGLVVTLILTHSLESSGTPAPAIKARSVWASALAIGQQNIWMGSGGGMFRWLYPPHRTAQGVIEHCPNQYLDAFAEYGAAGLLLLLWMLGSFLLGTLQVLSLRDEKYTAYRLSNRYAFAAAGLAVAMGGLVDAAFDMNLHAGGILFTFLAVMATTMTCGVHRRVGEFRKTNSSGRYITVRFHGLSRLVLVAGLGGLFLLIGTRLRKTYPSALMLRRGQLAMDRFDWDKAELYFGHAWKFDNRSFEAAEALGDLETARATWNLHQREALANKAFYWYRCVTTLNPHDSDVRIKIARLEDALGERQQALADYHLALDEDPLNASYLVMLGQHYLRWGEPVQARTFFNSAHEHGATEVLPTDEPAKTTKPGS